MYNSEAQAYACVALKNLIVNGNIKVKDLKETLGQLDREMYYLFDRYSEDDITAKYERILMS